MRIFMPSLSRRAFRIIFCFLVTCVAVAPQAQALSVEGAYGAIPHRRTVFSAGAAVMSEEEKQYLSQMFDLVDLAVVERVRLGERFSSGVSSASSAPDNYDNILSQLNDLSVPDDLGEVHELIVGAVEDQRDLFEEWREVYPEALDPRSHELAQSASEKLRSAYSVLMELYPEEKQHNQEAFFDYLCALDFL